MICCVTGRYVLCRCVWPLVVFCCWFSQLFLTLDLFSFFFCHSLPQAFLLSLFSSFPWLRGVAMLYVLERGRLGPGVAPCPGRKVRDPLAAMLGQLGGPGRCAYCRLAWHPMLAKPSCADAATARAAPIRLRPLNCLINLWRLAMGFAAPLV